MKAIKNALLASIPVSLVTVACLGAPPELNESQAAARSEYELTEAPTPQHELDIRFESRVRLVGYDVSVEEVTPGQPFEVTWYWQVDRRLPEGWQLFTHLADATDANRCNADHTATPPAGDTDQCTIQAPLRGNLVDDAWVPNFDPSYWTEGTWVRDPETITLPRGWHSDRLNVYIGFWSGPHRLSVTDGPNDGESRGRALSLPIAGGARAR